MDKTFITFGMPKLNLLISKLSKSLTGLYALFIVVASCSSGPATWSKIL